MRERGGGREGGRGREREGGGREREGGEREGGRERALILRAAKLFSRENTGVVYVTCRLAFPRCRKRPTISTTSQVMLTIGSVIPETLIVLQPWIFSCKAV